MSKQKKSNLDLLYLLDFLSKKRGELISPFLDKDYEWIGLSFKYERNQAAFDLVRERFKTLWIDKHFQHLISDNINDSAKQKGLKLFSEFLYAESSNIDDSTIKRALLSTKMQVVQELLDHEDKNTSKLNELKYCYERDKALFEREFLKYEKEILIKNVM